MSADIPLILFAKAPIAGRVKTRLTSHCSDQQAADIAGLLMQASIEKALKAWPGKVLLSAAINIDHPFFSKMTQRYDVTMVSQCEGHLGEKMQHALAHYGYPAAVMGCDVPHVSSDVLKEVYARLLVGESSIGPAEDGGYYVLGLTKMADELFKDKAWGTESVLALTLKAAEQAELELHCLESLNDVDEWPDLIAAASLVPSLQQYLQRHNLC